jgi:hypothetical protein
MLEAKEVDAYVKYNYFHKEQKRNHKNNLFLTNNIYYNKEQDFHVCPMDSKDTNQQFIITKSNAVKDADARCVLPTQR